MISGEKIVSGKDWLLFESENVKVVWQEKVNKELCKKQLSKNNYEENSYGENRYGENSYVENSYVENSFSSSFSFSLVMVKTVMVKTVMVKTVMQKKQLVCILFSIYFIIEKIITEKTTLINHITQFDKCFVCACFWLYSIEDMMDWYCCTFQINYNYNCIIKLSHTCMFAYLNSVWL